MGAAASLSGPSQEVAAKLREDCGDRQVDVGRAKVLENLYESELACADNDSPEEAAYAALRESSTALASQPADVEASSEPSIQVVLKGLPDAIDTACYMYERWPLVIDPTGNAARYLKYNGSYVMATLPSQTEPELLRKMLLACLKAGTMIVFNFGESDCSQLASVFDPACFPAQVLDRKRCFDRSVWGPLLKPEAGEDDPAYFVPNEAFKMVVVTECPNPTQDFDSVLKRVTIGDVGGGGSLDHLRIISSCSIIRTHARASSVDTFSTFH